MCFKMLKKIILLLFLTFNIYSQEYKINLEHIKTTDQVLSGSIDGKYDITIYLKLASFSEDHSGVYSVKGWYHYNKIKKNIPIVGIYNFSNGLTLYSLKDKLLEKKIISFDVPGHSVWDKIDYINSISDFDEKLIVSNDENNNKWVNKTKELKLKIYDFLENPIAKKFCFLRLDKNTVINLAAFSIDYSNLKIINSTKNKLETKVLLKYEIGGNPNVQGMCGGATDFGYIIVSFNSKSDLNYIENLEIENCRGFIYGEALLSNDKSKLKFKIKNSSEDKVVETKIIIDTNLISFIKEK